MSDQDEIVPETLSLEAYRSIVAYNPDSVLVVSIDKTIIEVNNRATELLGYSKESLVNQSFHSLFENEDRINQLFGDVRQGYSGEEELVVHLKNGGATHLSIKYMPMFQQDALIGVFIVLRDISTLYQTHESLQYTKNMFESLFHHTSNAIESFDMQGIVVDINPAFERIFGWQRQEVIGKPSLFQAWLHDMSDEFDALTDYNATITTKHDEKITVNLAISPIIDRHDNITGYTVVARDVTKQKQLQEQLSESEERYRLVAENTLDVIELIDQEGYVFYASPSHAKILGHEPDVYVGKRIDYRPDQSDDPQLKAFYNELVTTKSPIFLELQRARRDGQSIWLEVNGTPVLDDHGFVKHYMIIGREITGRKQVEYQLQHLANKDPLTGLANRRKLNEGLHKLLQQQVLMNHQIALLYLDLDEFKEINDTYGHHVGDELLRQVTERINHVIRGGDTFSRIGGDEFIILLPDVDNMEEVSHIAERILETMSQRWTIDSYSFLTTFSIGIALDEEGDNPATLIEKADRALYKAKSLGKNTYFIYNKS